MEPKERLGTHYKDISVEVIHMNNLFAILKESRKIH